MQTIQPNSADFSVATKLETPVNLGKTPPVSEAMQTAISHPTPAERTDWSVIAEEDSSFFVPERCTPLDDF